MDGSTIELLIEGNHASYVESYARAGYATQTREHDVVWSLVDGAWPHCDVTRPRFTEQHARARVAELKAFYASRQQTSRWWIGPRASPENLETLLIEAGYRRKMRYAGMVFGRNGLKRKTQVSDGTSFELEHCYPGIDVWPQNTALKRAFSKGMGEICDSSDQGMKFVTARHKGDLKWEATVFIENGAFGIHTLYAYRPDASTRFAAGIVRWCIEHASDYSANDLVAVLPKRNVAFMDALGFKEICEISEFRASGRS